MNSEADRYLIGLVADALDDPPPARFERRWARLRDVVDAALAWADLTADCSIKEVEKAGDWIDDAAAELRRAEPAPERICGSPDTGGAGPCVLAPPADGAAHVHHGAEDVARERPCAICRGHRVVEVVTGPDGRTRREVGCPDCTEEGT